MEHDFWHQRWQDNKIGFHEAEANPLLVSHFSALSLPIGKRVFLPLCGKTLDIAWLLGQGYRVVGAELSQIAIDQLFEALGLVPSVKVHGSLRHHQAAGLDIFVGDIFKLTASLLGSVDAVYDRAALVALPPEMRIRYSQHLQHLVNGAPQLLVTLAYDQTLVAGPPFSINEAEMVKHYGDRYQLRCLQQLAMSEGLKGKYPADESVWLLT